MRNLSNLALRGALLASAAAFGGIAAPQAAFAQEAAAAPADDTAAAQSIVVIGTRRTDRTVTNSASPIDIISTKEIATQASGNLIDVIRNIIPSFSVQSNSISDASTFVRSPSLRGLSADETLVMINGKRLNRSALVQVYSGGDTGLSYGAQGADISSIPAIALKNLQVLRDGATAQYGSDAIAGVMNYIARDNKEGLEVQGRYGQFYQNGDGKSYQIAANLGIKLSDRGFINISGEYNDDGRTSRGRTRPTALAYAAANPGDVGQLPYYPLPAQIWGNSPTRGWKILFNSELELSDRAKFYVVGNAARSRAEQSFNYRASTAAVLDSTGSTLKSPATYNPAAGDQVLCGRSFLNYNPTPGRDALGCSTTQDPYFRNLYPAGFTPVFVGIVEELWGVVGFKGNFGKLDYDVSASTSRNSLDLSMYNSLNTAFTPTPGFATAPYNVATQTSFDFGRQAQKETNFNLDVTYPLEVGFAKPIVLSGGFEYRKEVYQLTTSDFQAYAQGGASGYGGVSPQQAGTWNQQNIAIYGGAETDITSNWTVGIAGRYEHYNTFGSATVGKINTRYEFIPGFAIRGTVGTGFHAPSPGQQNNSTLTTNFNQGVSIQTGTFPVGSAISQIFGARPLSPEKSTNFGVGFTAQPNPHFTLTVDYYNIKVRNRIFISQPFPIVDAAHPDGSITAADIARFPVLAAVGVGGQVSYFTNGLSTLTQGVDVVATYNTKALGGDINVSLAYNHNKNKVTAANANVISDAQIANIRNLAPNDVAHLTVNYQIDKLSITARGNYFGSWINATDYGFGQTFGSKGTADLDVTYNVSKDLAMSVGANNLFNTFPDRLNNRSLTIYPLTGGAADGQVYARNGGPFGFNGGFWYARIRIKY
ncbi:MAG: TonB-dependent receptor [Novosphingobium sp.]|nr:TonB-dependent receptor [Novosphingobium sp.]